MSFSELLIYGIEFVTIGALLRFGWAWGDAFMRELRWFISRIRNRSPRT